MASQLALVSGRIFRQTVYRYYARRPVPWTPSNRKLIVEPKTSVVDTIRRRGGTESRFTRQKGLLSSLHLEIKWGSLSFLLRNRFGRKGILV
ncbi:hypothetical protein TNCV_4396071 [Trichonephila clavipes]|uniref:Uncharacterized protein n=1 Tax=Trichonephila clavipes TaxID=2585209 RepID=A0A8X6W4X2_TRICX|nr:hypothetical protein TNCV_4396071 [Trichonephila clavipes]